MPERAARRAHRLWCIERGDAVAVGGVVGQVVVHPRGQHAYRVAHLLLSIVHAPHEGPQVHRRGVLRAGELDACQAALRGGAEMPCAAPL